MKVTAFFDCPERTEFSDSCFSIIGRALFYATYFESNVNSLSMVTNLKINLMNSDSSEFDHFFAKLNKMMLGNNIDYLGKLYSYDNFNLLLGVTKDEFNKFLNIKNVLDNAREARNFIAHGLCKGIEHIIETDDGQNEIIEIMKEKIELIARADVIVCNLIQFFNKEPIPIPEYQKEYPSKIVNWVCDL